MNLLRLSGLFAASLTLVIAATACGGDEEALTFGQYEERPDRESVRIVHIHGLSINPRNGLLYAATHTGLYLVRADGIAERVGQGYQDTMGFTIVGPDQFLGSGHPDQRDYQSRKWPGLLGLISSDDGGDIWKSVSLRGEADFHALEVAHGLIYGYDSTGEAFMVSKHGGKSWETRSKGFLTDFAVSPSDPDAIVATNGTGFRTSTDGGRTWRTTQAEGMILVGWPDPVRLWSLGQRGELLLSKDSGKTWALHATLPGRPEAFLDSGTALFVAIQGEGIFKSEDGGETWSNLYRDPL